MSFRDYPIVPSQVTLIGDGIYIGPNMERAKVRPALQQLAADGRELWDELTEQTGELRETIFETMAASGYTIIAEVQAKSVGNVNIANPGTSTFDGQAVVTGNRILLGDQTNAADNGIYVFNGSGSAMIRATDFNSSDEVVQGSYVRVTGGVTARGAWVLTTPDPIAVGSTAQTWQAFRLDDNLRADLASVAAGKGLNLAAWKRPEAGSVAMTAYDKVLGLPITAEEFGAVGDGTTDDHVAIQKALDTGRPLMFIASDYSIGTVGITIKNHGQRITGNRAILHYYGSGHAFDMDASVESTIWRQDCYFDDFYIYCHNSCASGIRWRFSFSTAINVSVSCLASNSTAWRVDVDANTGNGGAGGSGCFYNNFINCHANGKTFLLGISNQTGWLLTSYSGLGSRGSNANNWFGGRAGGFSNNYVILGHGNKFFGVTSEAVASGGYHFRVNNGFNTLGDAGCFCNSIIMPYIEGNDGANGFYVGATAYGTTILFDGPTSLGAGVLFQDLGSATTWQKADGIRMPNIASTDARTFDWYEEGTFTPTIVGDGTAGTQTYAQQYGSFTRMGNRVTFDISIIMSAKDAATAGNLRINGLPFASAGTNISAVGVAAAKFDLTAGYTQVGARIDSSKDYLTLLQSGDNTNPALITATALLGTTEITLSGSYKV